MTMPQSDRLLELIDEITAEADLTASPKKIIGCFPGYAPEELVYAAGMLPVTMWQSGVNVSAATRYFPAFYCEPVTQALEAGMQGQCDHYAGVIIAGLCDTLKAAGQNWKAAVPQVEFIPLFYPHHRKEEFGRKFLITEYERIRSRLGELSGIEATDQRLEESIALYQEYRGALREFLAEAASHTDCVTPAIRHRVVTAGLRRDKAELLPLVRELTQALRRREPALNAGGRLLLTGIKLDAQPVLEAMEKQGLSVAADDLLQESRQLRLDIPMDDRPPLERLADGWSQMEGCSLLYDPQKQRARMLSALCEEMAIDGVVFCLPSFCDPEEYDYPLLTKVFQEQGVPCLRLEQSGAEHARQLVVRVEAFAELLNQKAER